MPMNNDCGKEEKNSQKERLKNAVERAKKHGDRIEIHNGKVYVIRRRLLFRISEELFKTE
mgnify:FL=1